MRHILGENKKRSVRRNGINYSIEICWHWLETGEKYHYIHVYKGINHRPFRRWAWATTADDKFITFV